MVTVRTDLGDLKESARHLRVETAGGLTDTDVQDALQTLQGSVATLNSEMVAALAGARMQRDIGSSADLPIRATDSVLNVNIAAPLAITVPAAATRNGAPLTFKDVGGNWATNNVTFTPTGADTFDGLTSIVGRINRGRLTMMPLNDGINAGYEIQDAELT